MTRFLFFFFAFFAAPLFLLGQNIYDYKMDWAKISKKDLAMTSYDIDPEASAVVLGEIGEVQFDFSQGAPYAYIYYHTRIKILKKSGIDLADVELDYYHEKKYEKLSNIKGQTIQPDGTIIKLEKKNIYETETNEYWSKIKFALPDVQVGSIIEYKYRKRIKSLSQLPVWYFQENIPKLWSKYVVDVPRELQYMTFKEQTNDIVEERENGVYYYLMKDIPAFKNDEFIYCPTDYLSKVFFQLKRIEYNKNGKVIFMRDSWAQYVKNKNLNPHFGRQYINKKNYNKLIQAIDNDIKNVKSEKEKVIMIQDFILSNVKWDGYYSIFSDKTLNKAFEKKEANNTEMNLMGVALLNHYGISSSPILVSTKANGKLTLSYPIQNQFNHTVIQAEIEGEKMLLDFSGIKLNPGLIRYSALNGVGLDVGEREKISWVELESPITNVISLVNAKLDTEGKLKGELQIIADNYSGLSLRNSYANKKDDESYAKRFIKEDYKSAKIFKIEVKNLEETDKKFVNEISFDLPNFANVANEIIYIPVLIDDYWNGLEEVFKKEERTYPLDLPYTFKDKIIFNLEIPEGYSIEEIPENISIALPDKSASFNYKVSTKETSIQVIISLAFNKYNFPENEFNNLKDFFKIVSEKTSELIVLKKQ